MRYANLQKAKQVYREGKNVTEFLRKELREDGNSAYIIEIAYDLQAGSYCEIVNNHRAEANEYAQNQAEILDQFLTKQTTMLDVGTGELTTLCLVLNQLKCEVPENIFAFDISWSRLFEGRKFWGDNTLYPRTNLNIFVANMLQIPMADNSVDIITSSHAIEPNGKILTEILQELFRVAKQKCILFEPSYELNSHEGQQRMDRLGYVKNIEKVAQSLGAKVDAVQLMKKSSNPLNPTACYIITPPEKVSTYRESTNAQFCLPGTNWPLQASCGFLVSPQSGLAFPVLEGIPILKEEAAILASSLFS